MDMGMTDEPSDQMDMQMMDEPADMMAIPETVSIGVVLPATGDLSSHGQDNNIAVQLAADDLNEHLDSVGAGWNVNLVVEDSQTDPVIALEKIQSLNSKGIKFILGTETSAELRNVKQYADSNGMMLLSPSSTSPKLAIDDNIFRFVPDDTKQGKVIARLLSDHDIKIAIPIYRGDVWGDGLYEASKSSFEALGGIVDDGIRYNPEITVFSTEANLLSDRVAQHSEQYSMDEIAIIIIGFSEVVHFLNSANEYENLHQVRWIGSDSTANDDSLTEDRITSEFIQETDFISTQFSASKNEKYERVRDHLVSTIGSTPNNYAYSSYDSLWVLGLTIQETQSVDVDVIKDALPGIAAGHTGAIGKINFNEYGDLAIGDYELWSIVDGEWELVGHYYAETDSLEFF